MMPALGPGASFDLDYYARVNAVVRAWLDLDELDQVDAEDHATCAALLHREARLLDHNRLEEWLTLFTDEAAYWLPADVEGANPTASVSWEFNDRRRLEERVDRLLTGKAYSQMPRTRTSHCYSNIEVFAAGPDERHVLCTFQIATLLNGEAAVRAGWNGFVLQRENDGWKIALKRVNLFDADLPQGNNSFTL